MILSSDCFTGIFGRGVVGGVDPVEELVVDSGEAGVVSLVGVVALAQDDECELGSGGEVDAGFADGFEGGRFAANALQAVMSRSLV